MRFRVLGPIEIEVDGRTVEIAAAKERLVLATLLATPNRVVPVASLIDELWGDEPPVSANKTLQTYISHLRRLLGERIVTTPPGYSARVEPGELDADEFERLVADGRLALLRDDAALAARCLGGSLALWRGSAFGGVETDAIVRAESVRLDELRLSVTEDWYDARVGAGDYRGAVAELESLVSRHPLREHLWSLLMQALYRSGRQADALRAFQRARSALVETLGVEPGPELRSVEAAVLGHQVEGEQHDVRRPATRYVETDDGTQIGYWTYGLGSPDIVFLGDVFMNLDLVWDLAGLLPMFERMSEDHRVVSVQRRGTGVSDRESDGNLSPPHDCVPDVDAVLDALGTTGQVALVGLGHGSQVAIAYAAARPTRVSKVVLVNGYARLSATAEYSGGLPGNFLDAWLDFVAAKWGNPAPATAIFGPAGNDPSFMTRTARLERLVASPRAAVAMHRALNDFDVRSLVPAVTCPVLVVHLERSVTPRDAARWLAERLASARLLELPGHFVPAAAEADVLGRHITEFLSRRTDGR